VNFRQDLPKLEPIIFGDAELWAQRRDARAGRGVNDLLLFGFQVAEQSFKRFLGRVMTFQVREVRDVVLAHLYR
jgi:hypothetical protein